jgi:phosphate-selective porin OprO/OprP
MHERPGRDTSRPYIRLNGGSCRGGIYAARPLGASGHHAVWPRFGVLVLVTVIGVSPVGAQAPPSVTEPPELEPATTEQSDHGNASAESEKEIKVFEWGSKGLDIRSRDGNYYAHIDWRAQMRFTSREFDDPIAPNPDVREGDFVINRARFKMGGHAYRRWLKYYLEYDLVNTWLLDLRFTLQPTDALQLRVGQWKVPYNRERVDSSGKQQFAERSIVTPWFTLDRQQGVALFGRLWEGTHADSWYNVGVFSATGRGGSGSVEQPMVLGRWQWNPLGRDLPFSQCDLGLREKPAASLAVAGASWQGPYASFSSKGGGGLPGHPVGGSDTYEVRQIMIETAFMHRGFSWQQEYHWKTVDDTVNGDVRDLEGWYAQVGYFFHAVFPKFPKPLEIAFRLADVDPHIGVGDDAENEATLAFNWFFNGHRNKLTFDISRLHDRNQETGKRWENRVRLQWDVSF